MGVGEGRKALICWTFTPAPRVSWGLLTAVLRGLGVGGGPQSTQDQRTERNLLAKSENVPKARLRSQPHARLCCFAEVRQGLWRVSKLSGEAGPVLRK